MTVFLTWLSGLLTAIVVKLIHQAVTGQLVRPPTPPGEDAFVDTDLQAEARRQIDNPNETESSGPGSPSVRNIQ